MAKKKPAPKRGASRYQAPAKKTSVPGWVWLVAGLAIGGFIMFLMKLEPGRNEVRREKPEQQKPGIAQGAKPATPAQQPSAVAVKPKYDFYTLLPGSEVVVPPEAVPEKPQTPTVVSTPEEAAKIDAARAQAALNGQVPPPPAVVKPATPPAQPPATQAKATPPATAPASKPIAPPAVAATQFFLQAGSFRKQADADRVRAQVILLGQSARVESGAVRDETWYRVMVGPYSDRAQVSAAQKQLSANGFSNLLLQQRQTR
ncbi:Cell division protein FtsN [Pseudomonas delhiensis]|uniref:Cell division protein FtsN n=1 Tax=Pseudomonas delhiensis TaxID=366289 RepID=A0A239LFW7_9PSED|nr:SPOR domain-containing protein [Pseudomonas delhiensis]SDJ26279.1 Cell division protein FtsN [Pseudomonas delhiensis]SNT28808.1 Cell division protein FtsN [Pseudomonas delhiensis]